MHGVSDKFVAQAFQVLGFPLYIPVIEQQYPDPDFPSVVFPNPEEKGMDYCIKILLILRSFAGALVSD
jgi:phosphomannomutase